MTADVARPGAVYELIVRHGLTSEVGCGYVGQTRQPVEDRVNQHRDLQPWGDLIVGWRIIEQGVWTDAQLDRREMRHIRRRRPWHNIVGNMDNPYRIPPWDAVTQRQWRDPGWVPPENTGWTRPQRQPAEGHGWGWVPALLVGWLLLFGLAAAVAREAWPGDNVAGRAAVAASVPFVAVLWWRWSAGAGRRR